MGLTSDTDVLLGLLVSSGAFVRGHFTLAGGETTDLKFDIDEVQNNSGIMNVLAMGLVNKLASPHDIQAVVGVATGGLVLGQYIAAYLAHCTDREPGTLPCIPTHKLRGTKQFGMAIADSFRIRDRRVLVVEDVLTTGGSVRSACQLVLASGGDPFAVAAVLQRRPLGPRDLGVTELVTLLETDFDMTPARRLMQR